MTNTSHKPVRHDLANTNISVAIINYNTCSLLERCLENLLTHSETDEILVVDNASEDGSAAMVAQKFPTVKLLPLPENRGLTVASNLALRETNGRYLLYLGADAYPERGVLTGLAAYMDAHATVGVATAELRLRSGELDMDAHRGFPTPWASLTHFSGLSRLFPRTKQFNSYFLGHEDLTTPHEIDLCISHFMFTRRSVVEEVNGWDEAFFLYGEDVDFCYRVKEAGYRIMYLPQFKVLHYKGASVGIRKQSRDITTASPATQLRMTALTTEAMARFYRKHYRQQYPWLVNVLILGGIRLLGALRLRQAKQRLSGRST
ncbi:MAG: glycosyltransferase family 2 protein [Caldilineaceae bacterium]|nr:glycosyltransferase family 2 protein [Caldilineaceae bacterium]